MSQSEEDHGFGAEHSHIYKHKFFGFRGKLEVLDIHDESILPDVDDTNCGRRLSFHPGAAQISLKCRLRVTEVLRQLCVHSTVVCLAVHTATKLPTPAPANQEAVEALGPGPGLPLLSVAMAAVAFFWVCFPDRKLWRQKDKERESGGKAAQNETFSSTPVAEVKQRQLL